MSKLLFIAFFLVLNFVINAQLKPLCFKDTLIYNCGNSPISITDGDFNEDGLVDIVISNQSSNDISISFGLGNGLFSGSTSYSVGANPTSVVNADFNLDTHLDLVVTNQSSDNISILFGTGNGTFLSPVNYSTSTSPSFTELGDYNGDSFLDLAVSNLTANNVSILIGSAIGTFSPAVDYTVGGGPYYLKTADFNSDGYLDIISGNLTTNDISVLIGASSGTFASAVNYSVGINPYSITSRDFNNDSKLDLVVSNVSSNDFTILFGVGDGTFSGVVSYTVGNFPASVISDDYNNDGNFDLVVTNYNDNNIYILLGIGNGTFSSPVIYNTASPRTARSCNLNNDIFPDIVVTNHNSSSFTVYLNAIPSLTVNSGSICLGSSFTITPVGAETYSYNISGGLSIVTPTVSASYTVIAISTFGCSNTAISTITVNPYPLISIVSTASLICVGQTASLTASGANTYTWNTNENSSIISISPITTTDYTVTGSTIGCSSDAVITQSVSLCTGIDNVQINDDLIIISPNPNNGQFNLIINSSKENMVVEIYDIIGKTILKETIKQKQTVINMINEVSGVYFVKVIEQKKVIVVKKIIKD